MICKWTAKHYSLFHLFYFTGGVGGGGGVDGDNSSFVISSSVDKMLKVMICKAL